MKDLKGCDAYNLPFFVSYILGFRSLWLLRTRILGSVDNRLDWPDEADSRHRLHGQRRCSGSRYRLGKCKLPAILITTKYKIQCRWPWVILVIKWDSPAINIRKGFLSLRNGLPNKFASYLFAQDGQHVTRKSFEVQIRDEQNFPPRFVSSLSGTIQEDMRAVSKPVAIV